MDVYAGLLKGLKINSTKDIKRKDIHENAQNLSSRELNMKMKNKIQSLITQGAKWGILSNRKLILESLLSSTIHCFIFTPNQMEAVSATYKL